LASKITPAANQNLQLSNTTQGKRGIDTIVGAIGGGYCSETCSKGRREGLDLEEIGCGETAVIELQFCSSLLLLRTKEQTLVLVVAEEEGGGRRPALDFQSVAWRGRQRSSGGSCGWGWGVGKRWLWLLRFGADGGGKWSTLK
jgi:hypothetical protein